MQSEWQKSKTVLMRALRDDPKDPWLRYALTLIGEGEKIFEETNEVVCQLSNAEADLKDMTEERDRIQAIVASNLRS